MANLPKPPSFADGTTIEAVLPYLGQLLAGDSPADRQGLHEIAKALAKLADREPFAAAWAGVGSTRTITPSEARRINLARRQYLGSNLSRAEAGAFIEEILGAEKAAKARATLEAAREATIDEDRTAADWVDYLDWLSDISAVTGLAGIFHDRPPPRQYQAFVRWRRERDGKPAGDADDVEREAGAVRKRIVAFLKRRRQQYGERLMAWGLEYAARGELRRAKDRHL